VVGGPNLSGYRRQNQNRFPIVEYQKLKDAFLQGDEKQGAEIFNEMIRTSVHLSNIFQVLHLGLQKSR
jgi:hypothetical protein